MLHFWFYLLSSLKQHSLKKPEWCLLAHTIQALCADPLISSAYHGPHFTSYLLLLTSRLRWKASVQFIYNDVCEAPCVTMGTCTSGIHSKFLKTSHLLLKRPWLVLCHLSLECGPFSSRHHPFVCLTEQLSYLLFLYLNSLCFSSWQYLHLLFKLFFWWKHLKSRCIQHETQSLSR